MSLEIDNSNKIKHLEFIQNIISRMATASFSIKTANVTIIAAISALAFKSDYKNYINVFVYLIPSISFWYLDGYYLAQERKFRCLYDFVRKQGVTDFSLSIDKITIKDVTSVMRSETLLLFYGVIIFSVLCMDFHSYMTKFILFFWEQIIKHI